MDEQRKKQLRAEIEERLAKELAMRAEEEAKTFDWDYDQKSQTLTISGQGQMPQDWHPWGNIRVSNLIIKDGVKSISHRAFRDLNAGSDLKIDFGNTLCFVEDMAFEGLWISGISVFPDSLISIGAKVFTKSTRTFCFKSQTPPSISDMSLYQASEIEVPIGCLKKYVSSSKEWQYLASKIKEKDVSLMHSTLELEAIEAENKRKEEAERKAEEERRKAEEEKKRKEEEERQKAEEEEYKAKVEAELRKQMGL